MSENSSSEYITAASASQSSLSSPEPRKNDLVEFEIGDTDKT